MINRKFRSVGWCAAVAATALVGYLVSHRVAAERGDLEDVEGEIERARAEILQLSTELGTRGRHSQLERWNRDVFALAAPGSAQYFDGAFDLVAHYGDDERPAFAAPPAIRQVSAPAETDEEEKVEAEPPAPRESVAPRLQHATYVVPDEPERTARVERVAFLDEALAGEIAAQADEEAAPAE